MYPSGYWFVFTFLFFTPQVVSRLFLHAVRKVVLPVFGPQCIMITGRRNSNVVGEDGREGMGSAIENRSVYWVVRFHCLLMVPQVVRAV